MLTLELHLACVVATLPIVAFGGEEQIARPGRFEIVRGGGEPLRGVRETFERCVPCALPPAKCFCMLPRRTDLVRPHCPIRKARIAVTLQQRDLAGDVRIDGYHAKIAAVLTNGLPGVDRPQPKCG